MNKRYAIFDMDGTLVDSMPYWKNLGRDYLLSKGITPPDDLRRRLLEMTMLDSGAYFGELGVAGSPQQIVDEINELMHRNYRTVVGACTGVEDYLGALYERGVKLCVATMTNANLAATCLTRLGLMRYFDFIASCEETGIGKSSPHIYQLAAARMGACAPGEAAVFEDAPYAARTAHDAGFYTIGVYDPFSEKKQDELKSIVDEYITDYREAAAALQKEAPCAVKEKEN